MSVVSKLMDYKVDYAIDGEIVYSRRTYGELMLAPNFWRLCKRQVVMSGIRTDFRTRFPGAERVTMNIVQDLNNSAMASRILGRAIPRPINTAMVFRSEVPQDGFDTDHIIEIFHEQKALRKQICDEVMELMVVNAHIEYDHPILKRGHLFWKLSLKTIHAINRLQYLLMAVNAPMLFDNQFDRDEPPY